MKRGEKICIYLVVTHASLIIIGTVLFLLGEGFY